MREADEDSEVVLVAHPEVNNSATDIKVEDRGVDESKSRLLINTDSGTTAQLKVDDSSLGPADRHPP